MKFKMLIIINNMLENNPIIQVGQPDDFGLYHNGLTYGKLVSEA